MIRDGGSDAVTGGSEVKGREKKMEEEVVE